MNKLISLELKRNSLRSYRNHKYHRHGNIRGPFRRNVRQVYCGRICRKKGSSAVFLSRRPPQYYFFENRNGIFLYGSRHVFMRGNCIRHLFCHRINTTPMCGAIECRNHCLQPLLSYLLLSARRDNGHHRPVVWLWKAFRYGYHCSGCYYCSHLLSDNGYDNDLSRRLPPFPCSRRNPCSHRD